MRPKAGVGDVIVPRRRNACSNVAGQSDGGLNDFIPATLVPEDVTQLGSESLERALLVRRQLTDAPEKVVLEKPYERATFVSIFHA